MAEEDHLSLEAHTGEGIKDAFLNAFTDEEFVVVVCEAVGFVSDALHETKGSRCMVKP